MPIPIGGNTVVRRGSGPRVLPPANRLSPAVVAKGQAIWERQRAEFAADVRRALDDGFPVSEMRATLDAEYQRWVADAHESRGCCR